MCTGWRILGTPPGGALSEGASRRPLGWWGVRGLLAVLALLAVAGSAPAWDFTMDLPPGWTMESPDEGDMVRCDLALEPGKTSAVLQVKRYDFDTVEEAADYYRRSLAQRPNPAGYNALGGVLRQLGREDEAVEQFGKAKSLQFAR